MPERSPLAIFGEETTPFNGEQEHVQIHDDRLGIACFDEASPRIQTITENASKIVTGLTPVDPNGIVSMIPSSVYKVALGAPDDDGANRGLNPEPRVRERILCDLVRNAFPDGLRDVDLGGFEPCAKGRLGSFSDTLFSASEVFVDDHPHSGRIIFRNRVRVQTSFVNGKIRFAVHEWVVVAGVDHVPMACFFGKLLHPAGDGHSRASRKRNSLIFAAIFVVEHGIERPGFTAVPAPHVPENFDVS